MTKEAIIVDVREIGSTATLLSEAGVVQDALAEWFSIRKGD